MKKSVRVLSFVLAFLLAATALTGNLILPAQAMANHKSGTASDMVVVATDEKKGTGGSKYQKWLWGKAAGQGWCAAFVSWCAYQAGASFAIPKNGGCAAMYNAVKKAGGKVVSESNVQPGDLVFYKNNKGTYCHVAIVTSVSGSKIKVTEGNFNMGDGLGYVVHHNINVTTYNTTKGNNPCTRHYLRPAYNPDHGPDDGQLGPDVTPSVGTGAFCLVNEATRTALEIQGTASKAGVKVATTDTAKAAQQFKAVKSSNGWYSIIPVSSSKVALNPYSDTPKSGTKINLYKKDASDNTQGWYFKSLGLDYYVIQLAYNRSLVLTADNDGKVKLTPFIENSIYDSHQIWKLVEADTTATTDSRDDTIPVSGTTYYITSKASGKALDVYGSETSSTNQSNVQIYTKNGTKSQKFKITETAGGWYSIVPTSNTKLAVNPYSDKPKSGTNINVYTLNAKDKTQGWIFDQVGDYYVIRSAYNNNLVLTADGTGNMSNVKLATYSAGNDKQLWSLTKA